MTMTAAELMVIFDALRGSLMVKDNGQIFTFGEKTRRESLERIGKLMAEVKITAECTEDKPE